MGDLARAWSLLGILMLVACTEDVSTDEISRECPKVRILQEAARVTRYAPDSPPDVTSELYRASIAFDSGSCVYTPQAIRVNLPVLINITRGAANSEGVASLEAFVAVIGSQESVLSRRTLPVRVDFLRNEFNTVYRERIAIVIPRYASADPYGIFIGIEVTPAEVKTNRLKASP